MFEALAFDTTPTAAPAYTVQLPKATATPLPEINQTNMTITEFVSFHEARPRFSIPIVMTPLLTEAAKSFTATIQEYASASESEQLVEAAALSRTRLLTQKYGRG